MLLPTLPLLAAACCRASAADSLREQIHQADTQLFAAAFEACTPTGPPR